MPTTRKRSMPESVLAIMQQVLADPTSNTPMRLLLPLAMDGALLCG
jgi:hypothetical protein